MTHQNLRLGKCWKTVLSHLKLENSLRWSLFTFMYNRSVNMNYFIYTSHHLTPHERYELNKLTSLPRCGFIAQLVEHPQDEIPRIRKQERRRNMWNRSGNTTDNLCFRQRFRHVYSRFRCCVYQRNRTTFCSCFRHVLALRKLMSVLCSRYWVAMCYFKIILHLRKVTFVFSCFLKRTPYYVHGRWRFFLTHLQKTSYDFSHLSQRNYNGISPIRTVFFFHKTRL